MASLAPSPWFAYAHATAEPTLRLFCLPHAGASAALYAPWGRAVPDAIAVMPVQLPGREGRRAEPALRRMAPLVAALADALEPWLDRPYALLGNSLGAVVAFELARELRRRGLPPPRRLIAAARRAPDRPGRRDVPLHTLPDEALIEALRPFGGIPAPLLREPELRAYLIGLVRADYELLETYVFQPEPPLACGVLALGGREDATLFAGDLEAWAAHTQGPFLQREFDGGHLFLQTARAAVLAALPDLLELT